MSLFAKESIVSRQNISALAIVAFICACGQTHERHVAANNSGSVAGGGTRLDPRGMVHSAPPLSLNAVELSVHPPSNGWLIGSVSWIAADRSGLVYLFQRGDDVDPVVVVDRDGHVVRSWGKGMYIKAHAIRVDPQGNIWTVDAATSMVRKYAPEGRLLVQIADGYANNRVLEYSSDGKKLNEWFRQWEAS